MIKLHLRTTGRCKEGGNFKKSIHRIVAYTASSSEQSRQQVVDFHRAVIKCDTFIEIGLGDASRICPNHTMHLYMVILFIHATAAGSWRHCGYSTDPSTRYHPWNRINQYTALFVLRERTENARPGCVNEPRTAVLGV